MWDPRQKNKPVAVMSPFDDNFRQCWAVAFGKHLIDYYLLYNQTLGLFSLSGNSYNSQERVICSGFDNGDIRMFDLRVMKVRWENTVDSGVSV